MTELVECFSCMQEDLSWIPRVYLKKISSVVVCREEGTGRSLRFAGYPALPNWRDPCSQKTR